MSVVIVLTIIGLILIYLEFFMPGGILAVMGGSVLLGSIIALAVQGYSAWAVVMYLFIVGIMLFFVCKLALKHIKMTGRKGSFYLDSDQEGFSSANVDPSKVGKIAVVLTDLKPSGHISLDGERWQARSESGYLPKGTEVEIVSGAGSHYIVKKVK